MATGHKYKFTLWATAEDIDALYKAAIDWAMEEGASEEVARELLKPDGDIDPGACLHMLLDPGRLAGVSIEESEIEQVEL